MILYHVTLFNKPTQEILIPRIPGDTSIGEEVIETMGVCFDRLEKYNAFQIMNEWLPRQSEKFQEQVKKKLTHKVEEYTEGSAEIYKTIFGNIPERFREEKDFREIEYLEKCKIEYIT